MGDLPEGWRETPLSEIAAVESTRVLPKELPRLPYVGMEHIESHTRKLIATVPSSSMKSTCFHFKPGHVLYGRLRPYLNKVLSAKIEGLCSSEFIVLSPKKGTDQDYLAFYLSTFDFVDFANQLNKGDRPRVSFHQIAEHLIPLPPFKEQRRIVQQLDHLMPKLEASRARLDTIPITLKRFRQAILSAACSGKLTEDWRLSHLNAKVTLPTSILQNAVASQNNSSLPASWLPVRLQDISELITKGSSPTWQGIKYANHGILFITSENVGSGILLFNNRKYLEPAFNLIQKRSILKKGDILINIVGASIGRSAPFDLDVESNINQAVALVRLLPYSHRDYILLTLNSPELIDVMHKEKVDVARANLSLQDVSDFVIGFPPIEEQREIVRRVETLFKRVDAIQARYEKARIMVDRLPQAILAKAFRGELLS